MIKLFTIRKSILTALVATAALASTNQSAIALAPGPVLSASGQTLKWTPVENAKQYRVQETTNTGQVTNNYGIKATTYTPPPLSGGSATFKVKSRPPVASDWSNTVTISYEPEKEKEPPPTGHEVTATPTGPSTPTGGWSVIYADAFGKPIGSGAGEDNTLFPNNCGETGNCEGFNSNEMQVFNPSATTLTAEGAKFNCTYTSTAQSPGGKHYVCGILKGLGSGKSGYKFFYWAGGFNSTLVFQAIMKLPPNTDEADPGWWSNGPPWNETEFDFAEFGGWGGQHTTGWKTDEIFTAWFAPPHSSATMRGFSFDPELGYHTYTTEIFPDNTYSMWIDGQPQSWAQHVGPVKPITSTKAGLILSYALRTCSECKTGFTSGTREWKVKSIAVYQDTPHKGVGIENEGLAPGTSIK